MSLRSPLLIEWTESAWEDLDGIADVLAASAGKAAGEVDDFGLAMKYVGPVAGQLGDDPALGVQPIAEQAAMLGQIERPRFGSTFGVEFMDSPQQPVDRRRALCHKDFSAIHQKFQFA